MKRYWLSFMALATLIFAGCSDYPSTGVVDTRMVREVADIREITGKAYGLKETARGAINAFAEDAEFIRSAKYRIWGHLADTGSLEGLDLTLVYPNLEAPTMEQMIRETADSALAAYSQTLESIEQQKSETRQRLDTSTVEIEKLKTADAAFKKATEAEQKDYDNAVQELNEAKQGVQTIYKTAATSMSKLAERLGFTGRRSVSYGDSLIGRYRTLDYTGKSNLPSDCPAQRGYETVDTRDLNNTCSYLHIGTIFMRDAEIEREARKILRTNFRALAEAMHAIGEDGSNATGLRAKVAEREEALKAAYAEAAKSYGSKREREATIAKLERDIQGMNAKLERLGTDEYRQEKLRHADVSYPEGYDKALRAYLESMESDLFANHVIELSDVTLRGDSDVKDGYFEDIGSGYVGVATTTDILASNGRSKEVLRSHGLVDLTDPNVAKADQITVPMDRDDIERRGRNDSPEKMKEALVEYLAKVYQEA